MNRVVRGLLLSLPAFACSICGSIFMLVFWLQNIPVGALNLTQTLVVAIACYCVALIYLIALGYCYSRGKCSHHKVQEDELELIE